MAARWGLAALTCMRGAAPPLRPTPEVARRLFAAVGLSPAAGLLLAATAARLQAKSTRASAAAVWGAPTSLPASG